VKTNISSLIDCKYLKRSEELLLFTTSLSGRVDIFKINDFEVTITARLPENGHNDVVRTVSVTPNRDTYITGGDDGVLCIWNITPDRNQKQLKIVRPKIHCKNFSPY
jgi:WD40 repeat protein